jgi:hypothetical protein
MEEYVGRTREGEVELVASAILSQSAVVGERKTERGGGLLRLDFNYMEGSMPVVTRSSWAGLPREV